MKRIFGIVLLLGLSPLVLFVLTGPPSLSGAAYVIGPAVLASAFVVPKTWSRRVSAVGAAMLVVAIAGRLVHTQSGGDLRVIDRVIAERDVAVNASRAIAFTHFMTDPDVPELPDAMRAAYDEMEATEGDLPSPFVATYLGLERPHASDTIELMRDGDSAVVFLHGSAGNFTMSCWLFARAARNAGLSTICPSTSWAGDWWTHTGETIVRDSIASLRARGKTHIYLAGLSNGGIGASRLAPRLFGEITGLVLVSGAAPDAGAPGVPTLVVQGRNDTQVSATVAHAYATRAGAKCVELDAGHFALLVERERAGQAITDWLTHASAIRPVQARRERASR